MGKAAPLAITTPLHHDPLQKIPTQGTGDTQPWNGGTPRLHFSLILGRNNQEQAQMHMAAPWQGRGHCLLGPSLSPRPGDTAQAPAQGSGERLVPAWRLHEILTENNNYTRNKTLNIAVNNSSKSALPATPSLLHGASVTARINSLFSLCPTCSPWR